MKKLSMIMCSTLLVLSLTGLAAAVPTTWTDLYDPSPDIFFSAYTINSHTYVHDITDNGFDVGLDTVDGYLLSVALMDDQYSEGDPPIETATIHLPGYVSDPLEVNFGIIDIAHGVTAQGLAQLNTTGQLDVTIERVAGDFKLAYSVLTGYGEEIEESPTHTPEPASMLLLGSGLVSMVGLGRKKFFKK